MTGLPAALEGFESELRERIAAVIRDNGRPPTLAEVYGVAFCIMREASTAWVTPQWEGLAAAVGDTPKAVILAVFDIASVLAAEAGR